MSWIVISLGSNLINALKYRGRFIAEQPNWGLFFLFRCTSHKEWDFLYLNWPTPFYARSNIIILNLDQKHCIQFLRLTIQNMKLKYEDKPGLSLNQSKIDGSITICTQTICIKTLTAKISCNQQDMIMDENDKNIFLLRFSNRFAFDHGDMKSILLYNPILIKT